MYKIKVQIEFLNTIIVELVVGTPTLADTRFVEPVHPYFHQIT